MCFGGLAHGLDRCELGDESGAFDFGVKIRIVKACAADGAWGALNHVCGGGDSAAGGNEVDNFLAFRFVESARTAGIWHGSTLGRVRVMGDKGTGIARQPREIWSSCWASQ